MDNKGKEAGFGLIFLVMLASLAIASFWQHVPAIRNSVHTVLDPTAGALLGWNLTWGMLILVLLIGLITTLVQKYATDQETLKELRKEQKILQAEMKQYREDPGKMMELQKKQLEFLPKTMKLSMRGIIYTGVPFILLFRWFMDYFLAIPDFRFFGFLSWFWFYLIFTILFSSILRKKMNVV